MWRRGAGLVALACVAVVAILPASASAISKRAADRAAIRALEVRQFDDQPIVLFGLPRPLRRGAIVSEAGPPRLSGRGVRRRRRGLREITTAPVRDRRLPRSFWLYWLDLAPHAGFRHASIIVLIDNRTGRAAAARSLSWWPLVNGRKPAFLRPRNYNSTRYRVYSNLDPVAGGAPPPPPPQPAAFAAQGEPAISGPPDLTGHCVVTIGDRKDARFKGDFQLTRQVSQALRLPYRDATTARDLIFKIAELKREGCRDVVIAAFGHGSPESDMEVPAGGTTLQVRGTELPTITIKAEWGPGLFESEHLTSRTLLNLMNAHRDLTFKFLIDACFSGRFSVLRSASNARFIAMSSRPDELTYLNLDQGVAYPEGSQTGGKLVITSTTRTDETTNHTGAGEFANGFLRGLLKWASTPELRSQTGDNFLKGLVTAFGLQREQNFAEQLGWHHAVLTDLTDRETPPQTSLNGSGRFSAVAPDEVAFGVSFNENVDGFGIYLPGGRRITADQPPNGFRCAAQDSDSPGNFYTCAGDLPSGATAEGRLRMTPAPSAGMGGDLYGVVNGRLTRAGSITGP